MYVDAQTVISAAGLISAVVLLGATYNKVHKWYLKQEKQDEDIKALKDEMCLLTYGLLACLKGLQEQGCNGPVSEAVNKIEKHINQKAHE